MHQESEVLKVWRKYGVVLLAFLHNNLQIHRVALYIGFDKNQIQYKTIKIGIKVILLELL